MMSCNFANVTVKVGALALSGSICLGAQDTPSEPVKVGRHDYVKLETRRETRAHMLELLSPSLGTWGDFHRIVPFPYAGMGDLETPHSPEDEVGRMAANGPGPDLNRTHSGTEGLEVNWSNLGQVTDRMIDLHPPGGIFPDNGIAYLYCPVESDEARTVTVPMGADDGLKVWCNGRAVHSKEAMRGLTPGEDQVEMNLEAGTNHIFIKVSEGTGGWAYQVTTRQPVPERPAAQLEYQLDLDFPESSESPHYLAISIPPPRNQVIEVGGMDFLPDGRPIVCTRRGELWIIENAYEMPPSKARFKLFAEGLHEPLGLSVRQEKGETAVYCVQRSELTRMVDLNGDDRCDLFETFCDDWGVSGNYHEFAFGPKFDRAGNAWVTLNVGFCGSLGKSTVPWRGWAVKVTPQGELIPVCDGLRSPNGLGMWNDGEMFYVDNQGDFVGTCRLTHLAPGSWAGHPASLPWREDYVEGQTPERLPASVWFPYGRMGQSTSDLVLEECDGKFGPYSGQFFTGDQTRASVMRVTLEKINGHYQGACYPFIEGLDSGVNRLAFASDGSLFVGQTDRGWGSVGWKREGVQRIVWKGSTPFAVREARAHAGGFDLEFTTPVNAELALKPESYNIQSHTYEYHAEYGAPEDDKADHPISSITQISERTVRLMVDNMRTNYVYHVRCASGLSADPDAPDKAPEFDYTLIHLPE